MTALGVSAVADIIHVFVTEQIFQALVGPALFAIHLQVTEEKLIRV